MHDIAPDAGGPLLLDVPAVAAALSCSAWSVRCLISSGDLPTVSLPSPTNRKRPMRRILIPASALRAYVERNTEGGR